MGSLELLLENTSREKSLTSVVPRLIIVPRSHNIPFGDPPEEVCQMRGRFLGTQTIVAGAMAMLGIWSSREVDAAQGEPRVSWSPCYRELGLSFECGIVHVPLDHSASGGATISIALVRLAATDPTARIGSLFFNPGGPGGSGVDFLLALAPLIPAPLAAQFDLIGFDPRGVARSTAVRCFGNSRQWAGLIRPFPFPVTPPEEALWAAADQYLADACDQRAARILDHMATADVVNLGSPSRSCPLTRRSVCTPRSRATGWASP